MSFTFDTISIRTVPPSYSWDKGTPGITFTDLVTAVDECQRLTTNNERRIEYVGYAPYLSIALSSDSGAIDIHQNIIRTANFGDYYNSESNIVNNSSFDYAAFSHTYVMPGLYSIRLDRKEYIILRVLDVATLGFCLQKYCVDWTWANFNSLNSTLPNVSAYTWKSTMSSSPFRPNKDAAYIGPKKWKFEPCNEEWASGNGIFVQQTGYNNTRTPLSWQWYNFQNNTGRNALNIPTLWLSSGFQQPSQLNWKETTGPCLQNLNYQASDIIWKWDNITNQKAGRFITNITWDETRLTEPGNITWDFSSMFCAGDAVNLVLSAGVQSITNQAFIRVLEIQPQAYLEVFQPEDRLSPLTVTISPRNTVSGSFPIEKIVWDLGDGSPLLTQRRWSPTLEAPFVFSGAISEDYEDPRNYDVVHTYRKTPKSEYSFYPSITAYASSTGSFDSAACAVGPLRYTEPTNTNFKLLQNELTDQGKVILGQVDDTIAIWRADK